MDDLIIARQLPRRSIALVLAGGRGSRLKQLTATRAKPAVYFGGKFRIIDFALSNCLNSGIRRIGVVTQYKSHSLLRHLQRGWGMFRSEMGEFIDLLPAQQRLDEDTWYRGTADAVYQNLDIVRGYRPEYVVILAGDHIYKMDYARLLLDHVLRMDALGVQGGVTVACIEVPREQASEFGVMAVDPARKIIDFLEKPADPPAMPGREDMSLASMGVYVFDAEYLYQLLEADILLAHSEHDFGKNLIPAAVKAGRAAAHPFSLSCVSSYPHAKPYWRDVGTIDAYWAANLDLASITPELDLYDHNWPIWTYQEQLPPAKFVQDASGEHRVFNTMIAGGCIVSVSQVSNSVLFNRVRIFPHGVIDQAVLLPDVEVGESVRLKKVVVDRGCKLPAGLVVGDDADWDATRFYRSENGVVLITRDMLAGLPP
ncbi:glucose-1-phosphate adenylyltransferase [Chitinimonas arctica]|uniref:Glucose-1-phosphate adenylyltransferase n=1 Tax=Chitinimonas arctica TaxID=2594795 RepID=A0A516SH97_9NEIS|nr:glucose-1-phosphate adenylyltransferase [Chitinimonas arctica]QDQ27529.1 glucose-1-phosphate adenylyltransferase [Chitinimonas arctica]